MAYWLLSLPFSFCFWAFAFCLWLMLYALGLWGFGASTFCLWLMLSLVLLLLGFCVCILIIAYNFRLLLFGFGGFYFLAEEVVTMTFKAQYDEQAGVDVTACGIVELTNDVMAVIDCSFNMVGRNEYEVVGTKGTVKVKNAFRPDAFSGDGQIIVITGATERTEYIQGDIYRLEIEYFSNKVLNGSSLDDQHAASRKTTKLLVQAYSSLKDA